MVHSLSIQKPEYTPRPCRYWDKRDKEVHKFFVYILGLESGELYIGHTRELQERMPEYRNGATAATAGKNPKLLYFEILSTRKSAMVREHEIKKIAKSNRREIYRMISLFRGLISKLEQN